MEREKKTMAGDFWGSGAAAPSEGAGEKEQEREEAAKQPGPEERKAALEQAMAELNAMVGLEQVKQDVNSLINLVRETHKQVTIVRSGSVAVESISIRDG